jgi:glutamate-1-semialdehyde 2,1-aminomutase
MDSVLLSYRPTSEQLERAEGRPVLGSRGQVANAAENVVAARWNSVEEVQRAFREHPGRIAAVVMEPVLCNSGCIMPCDGYLDAVQRIAKQHGALLMFDEVITGFRIAKGGAQEYYGITPDLATFGKAIGGGLTLSAIAGRREIMELMFTGGVAFGGSFNGNPLALAGAHATLTELSTTDALARAHAAGSALMEGLRAMGLFVTGFPAAFAVHFTPRAELREYRDILDDDSSRLREFILALLAEGVNILPDGRFYVSTVHTAQDVEDTLAAVRRALSR